MRVMWKKRAGLQHQSTPPKKSVKREKQLMLVISDRFLEEKSSMGDKVGHTPSLEIDFVMISLLPLFPVCRQVGFEHPSARFSGEEAMAIIYTLHQSL